MGFNKRFVNKENILTAFKNNTPLKKLFSADAIIFLDDYSSEVYKQFNEGISDKDIIERLDKQK